MSTNHCCTNGIVYFRYDTSVKHYRLAWDGKHLCFGLGRFKNTDELIDHFSSQPVVSGETGKTLYITLVIQMSVRPSGVLVYLRHPYPRRVTEPIEYEEPIFSEGLDAIGLTDVSQTPTSNLSVSDAGRGCVNELVCGGKGVCVWVCVAYGHSLISNVQINSKEGYLTKQGFHVKVSNATNQCTVERSVHHCSHGSVDGSNCFETSCHTSMRSTQCPLLELLICQMLQLLHEMTPPDDHTASGEWVWLAVR